MEKQNVKERLMRLADGVYFPVISILAAFLISGIVFSLLGFDPFVAFGGLVSGSVGSVSAWAETLNKAVPVILTGLSYAIAKRCGIVNLGAEGQVYSGALLAVVVGTELTDRTSVV